MFRVEKSGGRNFFRCCSKESPQTVKYGEYVLQMYFHYDENC